MIKSVYSDDIIILSTIEKNKFRVKVVENGVTLYDKLMSERDYLIYNEYIKSRAKVLLQPYGTLDRPFVMMEVGCRMYRMADLDYVDNHRTLIRQVEPIDYSVEESFSIDLLTKVDLFDTFTYKKGELVYRFGKWYLDGFICSIVESLIDAYDYDLDNVGVVEDLQMKLKEYGIDVIMIDTGASQTYFERRDN